MQLSKGKKKKKERKVTPMLFASLLDVKWKNEAKF